MLIGFLLAGVTGIFWGLMGLKNGGEWDYGICIKGINGT
jgi:hypothetical protein